MSSSSNQDLDLDRIVEKDRQKESEKSDARQEEKQTGDSADHLPDPVTRKRRKQKVLSNINQLPSLPTVVGEVMKLANDPKSNARDFEDTISKDQSLTARLLKMVNSSFFALRDKVSTISRAVTILGFKTLKSVVMAASTSELLDRQLEIYGYTESGLWHHSIACAVVTKKFAKEEFDYGKEVAEEAFVAGLLHDIGKIIISPVLTDCGAEVREYLKTHSERDLCELEENVVGIDHPTASEKMMDRWNLSDRLSTSIRHHHESYEFESDADHYAPLIELADVICLEMGMGLKDHYPWRSRMPDELQEHLGYTDNELMALRKSAKEEGENIGEMFASLKA